MNMSTKLKKRLRSQAGETIAEVLVAMLISVLALTMLAVMISSTLSMVNKSKLKMNDYYDANRILEMQPDSSDNENVTVSTDKKISIQSAEDMVANKLNVTGIDIKLYRNDTFSKPVFAYCGTESTG